MVKCFAILLLNTQILVGVEEIYPHSFDTSMELIRIQSENDRVSFEGEWMSYGYGCYNLENTQEKSNFLDNLRVRDIAGILDEEYFR